MSIGLGLCAVANLIFGVSDYIAEFFAGDRHSYIFTSTLILTMGITWLINGFTQGTGVPPCNKILTHWISPKELATKMSIWNTSHSIGAGLVVVFCGYLMSHWGMAAWRWCFILPAIIALLGAIVLWFTLKDSPSKVGFPELENTTKTFGNAELDAKEVSRIVREKVFKNPVIWILAIVNFFVYVVRFSILDWGPSILSQYKGVSLASAGWILAVFELFGILGMLVAGWFTDKVMGGRAQRTCIFCMLGVIVFIVAFWQLPAGSSSLLFALCLCGAGFFIYGPQALIGIYAANQATNKAAASANGLVGIFGYASTVLSGVGFGYVATHYGWAFSFITILIMAILSIIFLLFLWKYGSDGYSKKLI
jgi:OPA family glycerol-3-phosphate transporter-like MFS transporter/OPA family sugar phosphate sensor protein UhpC-like MFS transporter